MLLITIVPSHSSGLVLLSFNDLSRILACRGCVKTIALFAEKFSDSSMAAIFDEHLTHAQRYPNKTEKTVPNAELALN